MRKKKLSFWGGDGRGKVEEILEHPGEVEETLKQTYGTGGGGCPGTRAGLQTVQTKEDALLQRDAPYSFREHKVAAVTGLPLSCPRTFPNTQPPLRVPARGAAKNPSLSPGMKEDKGRERGRGKKRRQGGL